jgi:hypothetical protein
VSVPADLAKGRGGKGWQNFAINNSNSYDTYKITVNSMNNYQNYSRARGSEFILFE